MGVIVYFKDDMHNDCIKTNKSQPYQKIKGFSHIWGYFKTIQGNFIGSIYRKERNNAALISTIRNSPEGWVVHLWRTGGLAGKSYFETFDHLKDAVELCTYFLEDKFDI